MTQFNLALTSYLNDLETILRGFRDWLIDHPIIFGVVVVLAGITALSMDEERP